MTNQIQNSKPNPGSLPCVLNFEFDSSFEFRVSNFTPFYFCRALQYAIVAMLVLIDNYDSFTYNLVQKLGEVDPGREIKVFRNDKVTIDEIEALGPTHIVISPGPCTPREGGISNDIIRHFGPKLPVLGVCLGHQCIGFVSGATVERAERLMHGKTDKIHHDGKAIYEGMPNPFTATRYHSLIIKNGTLPAELIVSSWTDHEEIMGVRHKSWPLEGVQFHPESFLTEQGERLLANFLKK
jgi:anthranilate synthase/aminodeoxychorismate synthase-like glutamine amidotransferase